jgi:hypothetical protein
MEPRVHGTAYRGPVLCQMRRVWNLHLLFRWLDVGAVALRGPQMATAGAAVVDDMERVVPLDSSNPAHMLTVGARLSRGVVLTGTAEQHPTRVARTEGAKLAWEN